MSNLSYGFIIMVVGMGGTLLSLGFLIVIINLLKRIFPYRKEDQNGKEGV